MIMPRIQGRALEITEVDPADKDRYKVGEWLFEIKTSFIGRPSVQPQMLYSKTSYSTRDIALVELKKAVRELTCVIQEAFDGKSTGRYLDLKTGEDRQWGDEH